jgi:high affinity Mn2+ porin
MNKYTGGIWPLLGAILSLGMTTNASAEALDPAQSAIATEASSGATDELPQPQRYDAKFQSTYVWMRKPGFAAKYSGQNSLVPEREPRSYSLTASAFLGMRVWEGGEIYINPEMSMSHSLSGLHGMGALPNGENQKGGGSDPKFYRARLFLRQTIDLGGERIAVESAPNQLAGSVDKNRLVLTAGNISLLDIFDGNSYSHDPRSQFLNWTIMSYGAFDYASDARGYTTGLALEYYLDDFVFRAGRFAQPKESNGLPLDYSLDKHYGDQIEVEHSHQIAGQDGKLRLLGFHNHIRMGSFQDALDAWRANGSVDVPAVADVRKNSDKLGWGINLEQALGSDVGLFLRYSRNDGKSETYAFTEAERSLSGGLAVKGNAWRRPDDVAGLGFVQNGISAVHREYLANGGLGAFIGDGLPPSGSSFHYAPERVIEGYYNIAVMKGAWFSVDYQHAWHPAYNADRGPVDFFGVRLHCEL